MQIPLDEFRLLFFEENGFTRKRCPHCGIHYWTQEESLRSVYVPKIFLHELLMQLRWFN